MSALTPKADIGWRQANVRFVRVRIIAEFADFADPDHPYMYHCHILEHEDAGMMGQFVVI
jgi:FtsP/CotA-like multicopper oxidase with cupredoxin domain